MSEARSLQMWGLQRLNNNDNRTKEKKRKKEKERKKSWSSDSTAGCSLCDFFLPTTVHPNHVPMFKWKNIRYEFNQ